MYTGEMAASLISTTENHWTDTSKKNEKLGPLSFAMYKNKL